MKRRLEIIDRAAAALRSGQLVVFPTETVYGLGANAGSAEACARVFEAKARPRFNPLIVHLSDKEQLAEVATNLPDGAQRLADKFWPGPLTLVLPKRSSICDLATAGLSTVGVRVPAHPVAREMLRRAGVPVAAPSANRFMAISPTTVEHAKKGLGHRVSVYVDGGPCAVGLESTIVGWNKEGKTCLLRAGGLPVEAIAQEIGPLAAAPGHLVAPGMLERHYAPAKACVSESASSPRGAAASLLCLQASEEDRERYGHVEELAPDGDLVKAAARLFAALHRLEAGPEPTIVVRFVPEENLGRAINDRLRRAAAL